ncbi:MAG: hypothetical protein BWY10_02495 [Chloroflexi bacterium ADurb.Bin180]|nr:MAG: hypothetical protein BWY10_02495 [Chloroflexi bacterium ADurb.Bin180]
MRKVRESAARYVERLHEPATLVIVPALLVPEAAAAVRRGTGDGALAGAFVSLVQRRPNLVWVGLDAVLARQAAGRGGTRCVDAMRSMLPWRGDLAVCW